MRRYLQYSGNTRAKTVATTPISITWIGTPSTGSSPSLVHRDLALALAVEHDHRRKIIVDNFKVDNPKDMSNKLKGKVESIRSKKGDANVC